MVPICLDILLFRNFAIWMRVLPDSSYGTPFREKMWQ